MIGPIQQSMHDSTQEFSKLQEELTKNFNVILQQQQQAFKALYLAVGVLMHLMWGGLQVHKKKQMGGSDS